MSSAQAIKSLFNIGYVVRQGKGDHIILRKDNVTIIIPNGKQSLSPGVQGKVRTLLRRG